LRVFRACRLSRMSLVSGGVRLPCLLSLCVSAISMCVCYLSCRVSLLRVLAPACLWCPLLPVSAMGWLQLVGSIQLYVSFAKEPYKRHNILQKRTIVLSILLTVATPYLSGLVPLLRFVLHVLALDMSLVSGVVSCMCSLSTCLSSLVWCLACARSRHVP